MQEAALDVEYPPAHEPADWRAELREWAQFTMAVFASHPWFLDIPVTGAPLTPNNLRGADTGLRALRSTPLDDEEKMSVILLVSGYAGTRPGCRPTSRAPSPRPGATRRSRAVRGPTRCAGSWTRCGSLPAAPRRGGDVRGRGRDRRHRVGPGAGARRDRRLRRRSGRRAPGAGSAPESSPPRTRSPRRRRTRATPSRRSRSRSTSRTRGSKKATLRRRDAERRVREAQKKVRELGRRCARPRRRSTRRPAPPSRSARLTLRARRRPVTPRGGRPSSCASGWGHSASAKPVVQEVFSPPRA